MIKVLDKKVADKIAAGEVVERPISIVKELVENSVDSGASSIVVEIKNGGKSYIRVTDNGCGINSSEVEKAFLRHATSKINTADDLNSIETLGFRGEALASIAAVTRTELVTKTQNEKTGTHLLIHGGEVIENTPVGCPEGTSIIVSDLFCNTPVRLKFLKSDSSESSRIIEFISQIALAYSTIKFRFINNDKVIFSTLGKGKRYDNIMSIFNQKELCDLVPVSSKNEKNMLTGYISKPSFSKTTRKSQIFFVNGRVINSKVLEKAVEEGYKERLFADRHPVAFLFLETYPGDLDVNIHPNKREVRFDNEKEIIDFVSNAIKETLGSKDAVIEPTNIFVSKEETSHEINKKDSQSNQVDIKQLLSSNKRAYEVKEETIENEKFSPSNNFSETIKPFSEKIQLAVDEMSTPFNPPFDFGQISVTGSIFSTYITALDSENFYLIDQHAAHERIFYEKLVNEYMADQKPKQPILIPIIIDAPISIKDSDTSWMKMLTDMGFLIEYFGQNSYVIKEIPTFMKLSEAEDFVNVFLENICEGVNLSNTVVISKLITKSCKSAVKAHDSLSIEEINRLIEDLSKCKNPFSCPHGRPTFIKLSKYQIEKMFKRV